MDPISLLVAAPARQHTISNAGIDFSVAYRVWDKSGGGLL